MTVSEPVLGHPAAKMGLLTTLYFSQGLPFGFFTQAVPLLLLDQGYTLEQIGLSSALALPWALKFLWSPAVDRYGHEGFGRRKTWIVPLQMLAVALFVVLGFIADPEGGLTWLAVGVFCANLLAATQDVATDGFAVGLLTKAERGLGNGVQVGAYRLGMIVGGGGLLVVFAWFGFKATFHTIAILLALATIPIVLHRERPVHAEEAAYEGPVWKGLWEALNRPGMFWWVLLLCAYKSGDAFATQMVKPFLKKEGLNFVEIAALTGFGGSIAGLLGALVGGLGSARMGRRRALLIFGWIQAFAVLLYAVPASMPGSWKLLYGITLTEHFTGGMATASLFAAMMDACRPEKAGTDYTLQACAVVISGGIFAAGSGYSAANLGFPGHFVASALISAAAVAIALKLAVPGAEPRVGATS
jgi:PAT family beta-lactamase induction signal transducer AmpG